jgi:hypothetical protein
MRISASLTNRANTVGFVTVAGFEGKKAIIDINYLKGAIKLLDKFKEMGYSSSHISIGIDDVDKEEKIVGKNMLMLFLDETQTFGIALASIKEMEK